MSVSNSLKLRSASLIFFALFAYRMSAPQIRSDPEWSPRLILHVVDSEAKTPIAARISLRVDAQEHEPRWIGPHGLRFVSVHVSKRQTAVITYARGTGPVEIPLKPGAKKLRISVAKGLEYLPVTVERQVAGEATEVEIPLRRWSNLWAEGWRAADTHVHYDRIDPEGDRDWFHAMAGDGLTHAQFMMLKDGMVPGIWARQFAYGRRGEGSDGVRLIVPGEEYRDRIQGHLLLFGLDQIIEPIMAGTKESPHNYPVFADVLRRARDGGGMVGAAHGATLGVSTTGVADAVNGALDFWEIGNAHLWAIDTWYQLMNCGYLLPPTAGTDLPNNPYREDWQPFLGSIRTYVKLNGGSGSDAWNAGIRAGRVFVTSGPLLTLLVNGAGPGETVNLPAGGGQVLVEATLSGPRKLRSLEIVRNGQPVETQTREAMGESGPIHQLRVRRPLPIKQSCWLAARGVGSRIEPMLQDAVAHTAAVRVLVGGRPIFSPDDAESLIAGLKRQKDFYRAQGSYAKPEHRARALGIFDQAISRLEPRGR